MEENEGNQKRLAHQEDYVRTYTRYLDHIRSLRKDDSGFVKYDTTYGHRSTGYKGRRSAKNISLQMAPRRMREIAYDGIGVRDWDVESAYFTFAIQAARKLQIKIPHAHFQLGAVRKYLDDRQNARGSLSSGGNIRK